MEDRILTVDPLIKLFRDSVIPGSGYQAEAARGEAACLQIALRPPATNTLRLLNPVLLRSGTSEIVGTMNFVGFVPVRKNTPDTPPEELERVAPALFPDPILEDEELEVKGGDLQPVWVSVPVAQDQEPGTYTGTAAILCGRKKILCEITVNVHSARIPGKRSLFVTNWFWPDKVASHYKIKPWSDRHWQFIDAVAKDLSLHRQNTILAHLYDLIDIYEGTNAFSLDMSRFDRWVEAFERHGVADLIEGSHIGGREGGAWDAEHFTLNPAVIRHKDGSVSEKLENVRAGTERANRFLGRFLPALVRHLADRGWLKRYVQHIADEPTKANEASWRVLSDSIKKFAPAIRRMDAVMCESLKGAIDIWTPLLDHFDRHQDFFRSCAKDGDDVWFYTCLIPRGRYPNRFVDFSLLKVRLLPWINFHYSLSGYLHWGYNWWSKEPFADVEPDQVSGGALPPGDNAIVYPGRNGPLSSIRWEMARQGIEDYELLLSLAGKRPELAKKIAFDAVPTAQSHIRHVNGFRALRHALIRALDTEDEL